MVFTYIVHILIKWNNTSRTTEQDTDDGKTSLSLLLLKPMKSLTTTNRISILMLGMIARTNNKYNLSNKQYDSQTTRDLRALYQKM